MDAEQTTVRYKLVHDFPEYRVGTDGSLWSLWKRVGLGQGRGSTMVVGQEWRKLRRKGKGYWNVILCGKDGSRCNRSVHTMVLEEFVGPAPPGMIGLHGDGNPWNNRLLNLRWGTHKENAADMIRHGMAKNYVPTVAISESKVAEIDRLRGLGYFWREIAEAIGVNYATTWDAGNRKNAYAEMPR